MERVTRGKLRKLLAIVNRGRRLHGLDPLSMTYTHYRSGGRNYTLVDNEGHKVGRMMTARELDAVLSAMDDELRPLPDLGEVYADGRQRMVSGVIHLGDDGFDYVTVQGYGVNEVFITTKCVGLDPVIVEATPEEALELADLLRRAAVNNIEWAKRKERQT